MFAWKGNIDKKSGQGDNFGMIVLIVALVILAVIVIYLVATYNSFVGLRNKAEEALSALDAHLKQRYDLIPNLVETVKGYARHEEETLTRVVNARNQAMAAPAAGKGRAEDALSGSLKSLFALGEAYPALKADASFLDLQQKLARLEDDILNARKYYNAIARSMNDKVQMFPSSLVAAAFHFQRLSYIEVSDDERRNAEVRF